jgi:Transcriptional regulators
MTEIPPMPRDVRSMSVMVVAHLERMIATGELEAGSRLPPERELAATLQVARSTLREALHELESKHLIQRTRGRGTVVAIPSPEIAELGALPFDEGQVTHADELRRVIEPSIAGLAAIRATPANLVEIANVLDRASEDDAAQSLSADMEFHLLLAQAAQNPLLSSLQTMASGWTQPVRLLSHASLNGRLASIRGHRSIYAAVRRRDEHGAFQAMELHLREVNDLIESRVRSGTLTA